MREQGLPTQPAPNLGRIGKGIRLSIHYALSDHELALLLISLRFLYAFAYCEYRVGSLIWLFSLATSIPPTGGTLLFLIL